MQKPEFQPLPPVEQELSSKTWEELLTIGEKYLHQQQELVHERNIKDLSWQEQAQSDSLLDRVDTIIWQARITRAKVIMETPSSTPGEIRFARHVIWNHQVNQLIEGAIPTKPEERAKVIKLNGAVADPPKFLSIKEQIAYHWSLSPWDIEKIADKILETHPDPDGKIWKSRELQTIHMID